MTHEIDKPDNACLSPDDPLDAEYRELMALAGSDGCKCGIFGCPGHEDLGNFVLLEREKVQD